ncbi:MAG: ribosome silencing factor [Deltaproteobacteria bacterium]|nr:ribosome silencing factor [Deltaproteobacteria bacterium]
MRPSELARAAAEAAAARKAEDIVILDLDGVSSYCDAFVICNGTSRRQVRAVAEGIIEELRASGRRLVGVEGLDACRWVLLDFGEVIVHVFDEAMRGFYDLESLWGDARRVDIPGVTQPAPAILPRRESPARV